MCFVLPISPSHTRTSTDRLVPPCLLINQNSCVHKSPKQDSVGFILKRGFTFTSQKNMLLQRSQVSKKKSNPGTTELGFLEFLVDTPWTLYFPFKLPTFSLTHRRFKILISYVPT